MREIKFRAWDRKEKKIHIGKTKPSEDALYIDFAFPLDFKKPILMQFTGLHDKNGKEIYESDVLEWSAEEDGKILRDRYVVDWRDGHFVEKAISSPGKGQEDCFCDYETYGSKAVGSLIDVEVIGNIYENPNLLK